MGRRRRDTNVRIAVAGTLGFAVGVIGGLLLAPRSGQANRRWIERQTGSLGKTLSKGSGEALKSVGKTLRHTANQVQGGIHEARQRFGRESGFVADEIVLQRVRTELGQMSAFEPIQGQYVLDVNNGIITVRGRLQEANLGAALLAAISGVSGVVAVESRLNQGETEATEA